MGYVYAPGIIIIACEQQTYFRSSLLSGYGDKKCSYIFFLLPRDKKKSKKGTVLKIRQKFLLHWTDNSLSGYLIF